MSDSLKKLLDFIDDLLDSTTRNGRDVSSVDEEELRQDRCWDEHRRTL